jgi:anti-anti-sigma factor
VTTVKPAYNLNVEGAAKLEKELNAIADDVTLDLSDCAFVASSGLRVFLKAAKRFKKDGKTFALSGVNKVVREVLTISGLDRILEITA